MMIESLQRFLTLALELEVRLPAEFCSKPNQIHLKEDNKAHKD